MFYFFASVLAAIEKKVETPHGEVPADAVHIFDGMVLLQQLARIVLPTFGDVSEYLIKRILKDSTIVYFVTDQYLPGSVKSFERQKRMSAGSLRFRIERREQRRTRQWGKYLQNAQNKTELVSFLLKDWSDENRFFDVLLGKILYVNVGSAFFKLYCRGDTVSICISTSVQYLKQLYNVLSIRQIQF